MHELRDVQGVTKIKSLNVFNLKRPDDNVMLGFSKDFNLFFTQETINLQSP